MSDSNLQARLASYRRQRSMSRMGGPDSPSVGAAAETASPASPSVGPAVNSPLSRPTRSSTVTIASQSDHQRYAVDPALVDQLKAELDSSRRQFDHEKSELEEQVQVLRVENKELQSTNHSMRDQIHELESQLAKARLEASHPESQSSGESADALKRRVQELETERDTIKEKAQFLEEKCSQLMEDISRLESREQQLEAEKDRALRSINTLQGELKAAKNTSAQSQGQLAAEWKTMMASLQQSVADVQAQRSALEEELTKRSQAVSAELETLASEGPDIVSLADVFTQQLESFQQAEQSRLELEQGLREDAEEHFSRERALFEKRISTLEQDLERALLSERSLRDKSASETPDIYKHEAERLGQEVQRLTQKLLAINVQLMRVESESRVEQAKLSKALQEKEFELLRASCESAGAQQSPTSAVEEYKRLTDDALNKLAKLREEFSVQEIEFSQKLAAEQRRVEAETRVALQSEVEETRRKLKEVESTLAEKRTAWQQKKGVLRQQIHELRLQQGSTDGAGDSSSSQELQQELESANRHISRLQEEVGLLRTRCEALQSAESDWSTRLDSEIRQREGMESRLREMASRTVKGNSDESAIRLEAKIADQEVTIERLRAEVRTANTRRDEEVARQKEQQRALVEETEKEMVEKYDRIIEDYKNMLKQAEQKLAAERVQFRERELQLLSEGKKAREDVEGLVDSKAEQQISFFKEQARQTELKLQQEKERWENSLNEKLLECETEKTKALRELEGRLGAELAQYRQKSQQAARQASLDLEELQRENAQFKKEAEEAQLALELALEKKADIRMNEFRAQVYKELEAQQLQLQQERQQLETVRIRLEQEMLSNLEKEKNSVRTESDRKLLEKQKEIEEHADIRLKSERDAHAQQLALREEEAKKLRDEIDRLHEEIREVEVKAAGQVAEAERRVRDKDGEMHNVSVQSAHSVENQWRQRFRELEEEHQKQLDKMKEERSSLRLQAEREQEQLQASLQKRSAEQLKELESRWVETLQREKEKFSSDLRKLHEKLQEEHIAKETTRETAEREARDRWYRIQEELQSAHERTLQQLHFKMNEDRAQWERERQELQEAKVEAVSTLRKKLQEEFEVEKARLEKRISSHEEELHDAVAAEQSKWEEKYLEATRLHELSLIEFEEKNRQHARDYLSTLREEQEAQLRALKEEEGKLQKEFVDAYRERESCFAEEKLELEKDLRKKMDELLEAAEAAAREEISKREAYYRDLLQEADLERVEFRRQLEQEKKFFEQEQEDLFRAKLSKKEEELDAALQEAEKVHAAERAQLDKELAKLKSISLEWSQKLRTLEGEYDAKRAELEGKLQEQEFLSSQQRVEFEEELRLRYDDQYNAALEKLRQQLEAEKRALREEADSDKRRCISELESTSRTARLELETELSSQFEKELLELKSKHSSELDAAKERMRELQAKAHDDLLKLAAKEEKARIAFEKDVFSRSEKHRQEMQDTHIQALEELRENLTKERNEVEFSLMEKLSLMEGRFDAERAQLIEKYTRQIKAIEYDHNQVREQLERELQEQREELNKFRVEFQEKLRRQYEDKYNAVKDSTDKILAERDSALEEERLRLHHDYQERERKLRDTLEQTLQHKEESLQEHLRSEREKLEQQESARLEQHAIRVRDLEKERLEMDKRMSVQLSKRLAKEREILEKEVEEIAAREREERALRETAVQEREDLDRQVRKLKQSMFRWKVDFQKEMELRYKGVMEEMEQRLTQDLEDAKQEKLELQEKYMIDSVNWKEQDERRLAENSDHLRMKMAEERRRAMEEAARTEADQEGAENLSRARMKVAELWQTLESDMVDRVHFLQECESTVKYSSQLLSRYEVEIERLSDQLPIMESITRREFVKHRLKEFNKEATDPSRLFKSDPERLLREEKQRKEMDRELARLNEILLRELPSYERKHKCRFMYKGEHYLETMSSDVQAETREAEEINRSRFGGGSTKTSLAQSSMGESTRRRRNKGSTSTTPTHL